MEQTPDETIVVLPGGTYLHLPSGAGEEAISRAVSHIGLQKKEAETIAATTPPEAPQREYRQAPYVGKGVADTAVVHPSTLQGQGTIGPAPTLTEKVVRQAGGLAIGAVDLIALAGKVAASPTEIAAVELTGRPAGLFQGIEEMRSGAEDFLIKHGAARPAHPTKKEFLQSPITATGEEAWAIFQENWPFFMEGLVGRLAGSKAAKSGMAEKLIAEVESKYPKIAERIFATGEYGANEASVRAFHEINDEIAKKLGKASGIDFERAAKHGLAWGGATAPATYAEARIAGEGRSEAAGMAAKGSIRTAGVVAGLGLAGQALGKFVETMSKERGVDYQRVKADAREYQAATARAVDHGLDDLAAALDPSAYGEKAPDIDAVRAKTKILKDAAEVVEKYEGPERDARLHDLRMKAAEVLSKEVEEGVIPEQWMQENPLGQWRPAKEVPPKLPGEAGPTIEPQKTPPEPVKPEAAPEPRVEPEKPAEGREAAKEAVPAAPPVRPLEVTGRVQHPGELTDRTKAAIESLEKVEKNMRELKYPRDVRPYYTRKQKGALQRTLAADALDMDPSEISINDEPVFVKGEGGEKNKIIITATLPDYTKREIEILPRQPGYSLLKRSFGLGKPLTRFQKAIAEGNTEALVKAFVLENYGIRVDRDKANSEMVLGRKGDRSEAIPLYYRARKGRGLTVDDATHQLISMGILPEDATHDTLVDYLKAPGNYPLQEDADAYEASKVPKTPEEEAQAIAAMYDRRKRQTRITEDRRTGEERRRDWERRASWESLSRDRQYEEAFQDGLTGLLNRKAWDHDVEKVFGGKGYFLSIDADSLKAINDKTANVGGDALLKEIGKVLKEVSEDIRERFGVDIGAYRTGGDEFFLHSMDEAAITDAMVTLEEKFDNADLSVEAELEDGSVWRVPVKATVAMGESKEEADVRLKEEKARREDLGLRAGRGEVPPGLARIKEPTGRGDQGDTGVPERQAGGERGEVEARPEETQKEVMERAQPEKVRPAEEKAVSKAEEAPPAEAAPQAGMENAPAEAQPEAEKAPAAEEKRVTEEKAALLKSPEKLADHLKENPGILVFPDVDGERIRLHAKKRDGGVRLETLPGEVFPERITSETSIVTEIPEGESQPISYIPRGKEAEVLKYLAENGVEPSDLLDETSAEAAKLYAATSPAAVVLKPFVDRVAELVSRHKPPSSPKSAIPEHLTADSPEVEARLSGAERVQQATIWQKVKESLETARTVLTRRYPSLRRSEPRERLLAHLFDTLEHVGQYANMRAYNLMVDYTADLSPEEMATFWRILALRDVIQSVEDGLYDDKPEKIPFGLSHPKLPGYDKNTDMVKYLERLNKEAESNKKLKAALDLRDGIFRELAQDAVERGLLPKEVLGKDYFHRMVIDYQNLQNNYGSSSDMALHMVKRSFQKKRTGGSDFYVGPLPEFTVLSDMLSQIEKYDIVHKRIKGTFDILPDLKQDARYHNHEMIERIWRRMQRENPELPATDHPTWAPRSKMARALQDLRKVADLAPDVGMEEVRRAFLDDEDHPKLHQWLAKLAEYDTRGEEKEWKIAAQRYFAGLNELRNVMKDVLGDNYKEWKDMIPEGHEVVELGRGHMLYPAMAVTEKVLQQLANSEEGITSIGNKDLRSVLAMAGPQIRMVVPSNLAQALREYKPVPEAMREGDTYASALNRLVEDILVHWRAVKTIGPTHLLKFSFNNMTGDVDAVFANDPKILKDYASKATKDTWAALVTEDASPAVKKEFEELARLGVIGTGFIGTNLKQLSDSKMFSWMFERESIPLEIATRYFGSARRFNEFRESVLRVAAFRRAMDLLKEGKLPYWSSPKKLIDQLFATQPEEMVAARLATDAVGNYQDMTIANEKLARTLLMFWRWQVMDFTRYVNLFKNAWEGGDTGAKFRATKSAFRRLATRAALASLPYLAFVVWNRLLFPDEDDQVNGPGRPYRLVLWRDEDGRIVSVRAEGALHDFLEILGLEELPQNIVEVVQEALEGDYDGLSAKAKDAAEFLRYYPEDRLKYAVNTLVNHWEPITKSAAEALFGVSTYPAVMSEKKGELKPDVRRSHSRAAQFFRTWDLDWVFGNKLLHIPSPYGRGAGTLKPLEKAAMRMIFYVNEPGAANYWAARRLVFDWMKEKGHSPPPIIPNDKSIALYWYKKSIRFGDEKNARYWLKKYYELGGNRKSIKRSSESVIPLPPKKYRREFLDSLTPEERKVIDSGIAWWKDYAKEMRSFAARMAAEEKGD